MPELIMSVLFTRYGRRRVTNIDDYFWNFKSQHRKHVPKVGSNQNGPKTTLLGHEIVHKSSKLQIHFNEF